MKVEIWSDIACPFCYIGKAHFEKALEKFGQSDEVEVVYKSYQLDPDYHHQKGDTALSVLSQKKGMPETQVEAMTSQIVEMAHQVDLKMDFKNNLPANTFDAHRLIHLAAKEGKQKEVLEALFEAHFTDGKNIEEKSVLIEIGQKIGLSKEEVERLLTSDEYAYDVKQDIMEARNIGVRGVPFFVFNQKYALSGAQPIDTFDELLNKSYTEWKKDHPTFQNMNSSDEAMCSDDGCEL